MSAPANRCAPATVRVELLGALPHNILATVDRQYSYYRRKDILTICGQIELTEWEMKSLRDRSMNMTQ
eukprot:5746262-Amphidinium_carterae.1